MLLSKLHKVCELARINETISVQVCILDSIHGLLFQVENHDILNHMIESYLFFRNGKQDFESKF